MCPDAAIGETGVVNGVTYTKRTREQITPANAATTCTSGITYMSQLFRNISDFNEDISTWDVSSVTNMSEMFDNYFGGGNFLFNQDLSYWDTSNVTSMHTMFRDCYIFNSNLENWDVGNVWNMWSMFEFSKSFNQDISSWDVSNVTSMSGMFLGADEFNQDIGNWNVGNVTSMNSMFWGWNAEMSFDQDISNWEFNSNVSLLQFLSFSGMSKTNYDSLLQSLSNQNLAGRTIGVDNLIYCNESARNQLIASGWSFSGDSPSIVSMIVPESIVSEPDPDLCTALGIDLGQPTVEGCGILTVTNNAPIEYPLGVTTVTWTLLDGNGITITDYQNVTVTIELDEATVCYVTSDETEFTKNRIFINNLNWNNVEHYQILRESSANVYEPIGIITQGQTSFLDVTSNNSSQNYRYRVRTLDICDNLSSSSPIHRTILLQSSVATNNSVNLSWNAYEGVSFGSYNIYRKVNEEDFEVIATLPSTNFSYNDTQANVLENTYQYYVGIEIQACVTGFNTVEIKSNREIFDPNMSVGDILLNNQVILYPNPSSSRVTIQLNEDIQFIKGEVYNMLGQKVMDVNQSTFLITNLAAANYFIKIYTTEGQAVKQFVKF
jgi:surface protein